MFAPVVPATELCVWTRIFSLLFCCSTPRSNAQLGNLVVQTVAERKKV